MDLDLANQLIRFDEFIDLKIIHSFRLIRNIL